MLLEIKSLNKFYGKNHVLKDVSFTASSERTLGLLGRNGHGKTTTMKILMGIIYADSGEVFLDGAPLKKSSVKLGYLPEERGLYAKVVILEQMIYFGKLRGMSTRDAKKSATDILEKLGMTEYIKKRADSLSKGNQQKIQLGIALLNDPDIIVLDEPFSGLDPVNSKILQNLITENSAKQKLIIFSSHQMAQVEEFCQDVCIINRGEVKLHGNLHEIKNTYPKDKIRVLTSHGKEEVLDAPVDGCLATVASDFNKRGIDIDSISFVKPTLLQIFLETAGDENERA